MDGNINVRINYDKIKEDTRWNGLKSYLTNVRYRKKRDMSHITIFRAFRIAKSKIERHPMLHFTHRRIEAHVCICFVALKIYKELERILKLTDIKMNVDKVMALAQAIVTLQIQLPQNKTVISKTMIMKKTSENCKTIQ